MNYYEILGVSEDASQSEIKQAYRRLTLKTHPDKNINGNDNEFKKLTEAFETLWDIDKRMQYDAFNNKNKINSFKKKNQSLIKVGNYSDLFVHHDENKTEIYEEKDFVNKINENKKKSNYVEPIRKNLEISIEESFNGCCCPLQIERKIGNLIENELIYINIPPGTDKGEVIELKEKGNIDKYGNIGDIRITIDILQNNKYLRNKLDVIMNVEITLLQSLCGFTLDINHLDGKIYRINSNEGNVVASGTKRIIPKKGFTRGETTGNLIILFNVIYPEKINFELVKKLRDLFEDL
jgi:DnaJ-class molecular chaperone